MKSGHISSFISLFWYITQLYKKGTNITRSMDFYISNMLRKVMIYFTPQVGTFTFNINIWWPTFAYQWQYL